MTELNFFHILLAMKLFSSTLSLSAQTNLAFLFILFIPISISGFFGIHHFTAKITAEAGKAIRADARLASAVLKNHMNDIENIAQLCSKEPKLYVLIKYNFYREMTAPLKKLADEYNLSRIVVLNDSRIVVANTSDSKQFGKTSVVYSDNPLIDYAYQGKIKTCLDIVKNKITITSAVPLFFKGSDDLILGIVLVYKVLDDNFIKEINTEVDSANIEIVRNGFSQNPPSSKNQIEDVEISKTGALRVSVPLHDFTNQIIGAMVVSRSAKPYFDNQIISTLFLIGAMLIGLILAYFVKHIIKKRVLVRLKNLVEGIEKFATGDYEYRVPITYYDEIGVLVKTFNHMAERIEEYNTDLEEQVKQRTAELKELQNELVKNAHAQGQSQMAIGFLHSVGNAITPASVSNTFAQRHIAESVLFRNLPGFLHEVKEILNNYTFTGKERIIQILDLMPGEIRKTESEIGSNIDRTLGILRHIEDVIKLQMNYARVEVLEKDDILVNFLIEDAIKFLGISFDKRNIEIKKHLSTTEPIGTIERTKILLILLNILKNAYEAIDIAEYEGYKNRPKRIVISTRSVNSSVEISIRDTGIGFTKQEQQELFTYGFTTKKNKTALHKGSGFGLYPSMRYLATCGGKITALSDGIGQGSEFIIKIPLTKTTNINIGTGNMN